MNTEHIMLFGGAFDPPHIGHENIVNVLLDKKNIFVDEVWYVPTGVHDFQKNMTAAGHRIAMLKFLLRPSVKIETCEIHRQGVSHTYDTLSQLSQVHPDKNFSFLIGSDNLRKFHLWDKYQELLARFKVYVYPRQGFDFKPLYKNMHPLTDVPQMDISSTKVRTSIKQGIDVKKMLNEEVYNYIDNNQLYQ